MKVIRLIFTYVFWKENLFEKSENSNEKQFKY
jgi:hypothetical protein